MFHHPTWRGAPGVEEGGERALQRRLVDRLLQKRDVGIAALDDEVPALDVALFAQSLQERLFQMTALRKTAADKDADMGRFFRSLREARSRCGQQQSTGDDRRNALQNHVHVGGSE